jgi:hypothetical protein
VDDLVPCTAEFHALVVALVSAQVPLRDRLPPAQAAGSSLRWVQLSSTLAQVREQLVRRQGLVDQALKIMVPAMHMPVYAGQAGPYGAGGLSSGRFQTFTA